MCLGAEQILVDVRKALTNGYGSPHEVEALLHDYWEVPLRVMVPRLSPQ